MKDLKDWYTALESADKAGDTAAATEIAAYIASMQPQQYAQYQEPVIDTTPKQSGLRQLADVPLKAASGAISGIRFISDAFGADNAVSQNLRGMEDWVADLYSAQSKQDSAKIAQIMQEAEDQGLGAQLKAAVQAFATAPVDILAQGLGTAAPTIATGMLGSLARLGTMGVRGIQAGTGATMGAGVTKSSIYDAVKQELTNSGLPAEEAERRAVAAQSYAGENLDMIATGAGIGAITGITGLEPQIIRGILGGAAKEAAQATAQLAPKGMARRAGETAVAEALPETVQGAQEQLAQNIALQREGFDVPTMRGVYASGAMEGLAGAGLGAGIGAISQDPAAIQRANQEAETNRKLAEINAERARQQAIVDEAKAALPVMEERQADLAGFAQAKDAFTTATEQLNASRTRLQERFPEGKLAELFGAEVQNLDTPEGVGAVLKDFNKKFALPAEEAKTVKQELKQYEQNLRKNEAKFKELAKVLEVEQEAYDALEVKSMSELLRKPLPELQDAKKVINSLQEPGLADENLQRKYDRIEYLLEQAIAQKSPTEIVGRLQVPPYEPGRPATTTLTSFQQLGQPAPEPVNIPTEAFPQPEPELSIEERMEQLERAQQEQEAADFELQEQYPEAVAPTTQEVMKGEANEPAPRAQGRLFTAAGKPTVAAAGRQPVSGAEVTPEVSDTDGQRGIDSVVLPRESTEAATQEAEGPRTGGLGTVDRPSEGGAVRRGRGAAAEPATLTEPQVTTARERAAEVLEEAEPTTREEANKRAQRDIKEALQQEAEGYDPDMYSKPGKAKRKKDGSYKQVPSLKTLKADKPSSVEAVEKAAERLFNPVWLKQAQNQGWLHILPGKPSDVAELANANVPNAQGVYMGRKGHVYIFPENIPAGGERGVLLHEIGEHKGLDAMIGAENVTRLANRVRTMAEGSDRDAEIAKRAIQRAEESGTVDDKEIVAYFTEVAVNEAGIEPGSKAKPGLGKALQWINELWSSISAAMRKLALNVNTINSQDMVDIVYGAARLQMGATLDTSSDIDIDVGNEALTPEDTEILRQSVPRNPAMELTDADRQYLKNKGLIEFPTPQRQTVREQMLDTMGVTSGFRAWLDKKGNEYVGPLFTLNRKASAYYGPENFYSKTTGKLLGSLMAQHALNANNLTFDALKNGTMRVDDKGFVETVDSPDNVQSLTDDYNNIIKAMMRDGLSYGLAYQQVARMILAPRYKALVKMGIKRKEEFDSANMTEAEQLQQKYSKEYQQWRDRYNRIRQNKRQFLLDTGLFTPKKVDEFLDRTEYVPFYRLKDSEGMDGVFMQNMLSAKGEQKLKFDTAGYDMSDIMGNIAKNEMWMYKRGIYNHTINLTADQVEEMGGGRYLKVRPADAEGVITFNKNGQIVNFKFDDPNDMAVFKSVPVINSMTLKMMAKFGQILRKTITLTPSFVYRQVWQDVERAWMQAGNKASFMSMLGTSIREQAKNARAKAETDTARQLRKRGVVGAIEYQDTFDNALDELLGREPETNFKRAYKVMEFMERLAQNSDLAARATVYNASVKEGATPGEAALRAQMMLNYQHRGTSMALRTLLSTIPFLNTKIQGEWRLVEALQGKIPGLPKEKARMLLASKIAKMMLFTTAYAMMRTDEDDYEKSSEETRNRNFLFNVGGVPLKIPVAPEYMIPKVIAEQTVRNVMDAEFSTDRKTGHAVMSAFAELLLSPSDALPSVIRPVIENITNYSFFGGRPLVGVGLQGLATNEQYIKGQTSELSKFISDVMYAVGGDVASVSPIKIDNMINGLFGTFGRDVLWLTNQLDAAITGEERADLRLSQLPELGAAFYNDMGSQRIADFYDLRERVMKRYNTYLDLRKTRPEEARAYMQENKSYLQVRPQVTAINNQLAQLRKQRNRILEDKNMSGAEKREKLDALAERTDKFLGNRVQQLEARLD